MKKTILFFMVMLLSACQTLPVIEPIEAVCARANDPLAIENELEVLNVKRELLVYPEYSSVAHAAIFSGFPLTGFLSFGALIASGGLFSAHIIADNAHDEAIAKIDEQIDTLKAGAC